MEHQCLICEKYFTFAEIESGEKLQTFKNQHCRLVMIQGVVHKFPARRGKRQFQKVRA